MTGNDRSNKNTKMCRSKWADLEITQIKYLWGQTSNINGEGDPVYYRREEGSWKLERNGSRMWEWLTKVLLAQGLFKGYIRVLAGAADRKSTRLNSSHTS